MDDKIKYDWIWVGDELVLFWVGGMVEIESEEERIEIWTYTKRQLRN